MPDPSPPTKRPFVVMRRASLMEDEGHDSECGQFADGESARARIAELLDACGGYFRASEFYIRHDA
jgi:hypothetical protein